MNAQPQPQPRTAVGGGVDLAQVGARAAQRAMIDRNREQLVRQALTQAGLICPCGERIRGCPTLYFTPVDEIPMPDGTMVPGVAVLTHTCCSRTCAAAQQIEPQAIARRDGPAGRVTWLDELRAARAAAAQSH